MDPMGEVFLFQIEVLDTRLLLEPVNWVGNIFAGAKFRSKVC